MPKENKGEVKEPFCASCMAGLAALAGAGTAHNTKDNKRKNVMFWIGVSVSVISIVVLIYLLFFKDCKDCK